MNGAKVPWQSPGSGAVQCELTVWEVRVAELQIFAGPGWVILGAHRKLHVLDILLQGIQGAKDLLHTIGVIQNIITSIRHHIVRRSSCLLR